MLTISKADDSSLTWTMIQPENDSRDADVRACDDSQSSGLVKMMNRHEKFLQNRLTWRKTAIKTLLSAQAPFSELRFDAITPFNLTAEEKRILREYLTRGGFIMFIEDAYPYWSADRRLVKSWPLVDFISKELSALDSDFKLEPIDDKHPIFHQYYSTETEPAIQREMNLFPELPYRLLLTYRGRPAGFVTGRFFLAGNRLVSMQKPFPTATDNFILTERAYKFSVNLYMFAAMH